MKNWCRVEEDGRLGYIFMAGGAFLEDPFTPDEKFIYVSFPKTGPVNRIEDVKGQISRYCVSLEEAKKYFAGPALFKNGFKRISEEFMLCLRNEFLDIQSILRYNKTDYRVSEYEKTIREIIHDILSNDSGLIEQVGLIQNLSSKKILSALLYFTNGDREARRQAVEHFPSLSDFIISNKAFCSHIDHRRPMIEAFKDEKVFGLSTAEAKNLMDLCKMHKEVRKVDWENPFRKEFANVQYGDMINVAKNVRPGEKVDTVEKFNGVMHGTFLLNDGMAGHVLPSSRTKSILMRTPIRDWKDIRLGIQDLSRTMRDYRMTVMQTVLSASYDYLVMNDNHEHFMTACSAYQACLNGMPVEDVGISAIDDVIKSRSRFNLNNYRRDEITDAIWEKVCEKVSLKDLKSLNERWHHHQARLLEEAEIIHNQFSWSPYIGIVDLGDGIVARELTSNHALKAQGKDQSHCVGGYTQTVMNVYDNQATLIFSIEKDGEVLSTVELEVANDNKYDPVDIRQNHAANNYSPSSLAVEKANVLSQIVGDNVEKLTGYIAGMRENNNSTRHKIMDTIQRFGINIFEPHHATKVLNNLGPFLPHSVREMTAKDWVEHLGITDVYLDHEVRPDQVDLAHSV